MSRRMVYEDVPRLNLREGDHLVAGANNTCIVLGRDRPTDVNSGYGSFESLGGGKKAGSIQAVAGRSESDFSFDLDGATVYITAHTSVDRNALTTGVGESTDGASAIMLRADCIRIVPRKDFKILLGNGAFISMAADGTIVLDGNIQLGKDATERILKGESFVAAFSSHLHATPTGISGPPVDPVPDSVYSSRTARVQ